MRSKYTLICFFVLIGTSFASPEGTNLMSNFFKESLLENRSQKLSTYTLDIIGKSKKLKVSKFLIGDHGEGGGTKELKITEEINYLLDQVALLSNSSDSLVLGITSDLAEIKKSNLPLASIKSFFVKQGLFVVKPIEIHEIEYFYLRPMIAIEDNYLYSHLEGFKLYNGEIFLKKEIQELDVDFIFD